MGRTLNNGITFNHEAQNVAFNGTYITNISYIDRFKNQKEEEIKVPEREALLHRSKSLSLSLSLWGSGSFMKRQALEGRKMKVRPLLFKLSLPPSLEIIK